MTQLSRREFAVLAGATFAAPLAASQKTSGSTITAQDVIDRIRMNIGANGNATPSTAQGRRAIARPPPASSRRRWRASTCFSVR